MAKQLIAYIFILSVLKQQNTKLVDIIKLANEVLSDGGVVPGDSIIHGFILGDVGISQIDRKVKSLEDPVTILGEGSNLAMIL